MLKKALVAMLLWTVTTQGAELEIGLNMTVRGGADAQAVDATSSKHASILVVDKSGSMVDPKTRRDGQLPRDILRNSLAVRLDALPIGEAVYLLPFSSKVEKLSPPAVIKSQGDRDGLRKAVDALEFSGVTLLYDAQAAALRKAQELMQADRGLGVSVFVYTDGDHFTDRMKSEFPRTEHDYKTNPEGSRQRAWKLFKDKFCTFFDEPGLEMEYEWLSDSRPPDASDWETKPRLKMNASPSTLNLKPAAEPKQKADVTVDFQVPDKFWGELDGKTMELAFAAGGKCSSSVVKIMKGKSSVKLSLPALPDDREVIAALSLSSLPAVSAFELSPPKPIEIVFAKPGTVSLSSVLPPKGKVICAGDTVSFSAKATDGAVISWTFSDGVRKTGESFALPVKTAGDLGFTVEASKPGLISAKAEGALEVVETGITLSPLQSKPTVGVPVTFNASVKGNVIGYEWVVDGHTYAGKETFTNVFEKSKDYVVQARALYKVVAPALSQELVVTVAPAPFVVIREPEAGSVHNADTNIVLRADVEGGFSKVVWKIEGPDAKTLESPVADRGSLANLRVAKGGEYKVTAVAEGTAGMKAGTPVSFSVPPPDFRIAITEPLAYQMLENGKGQRLVASVTGKGIDKVKWSARNVDTGKLLDLGEVPVAAGTSSRFYTFPLETGDARLEICAEAVFAEGDPNMAMKVEAPAVPVTTETKGEIEIARGEDLDGSTKAFDEPLKLMCEVSGAIKATDVEWFFIGSGGHETPLTDGKGKAVFTHAFASDGREKAIFDIFARGTMPDGSFKETKKMRVIGECPKLIPWIKMPETNGVKRVEFGLKEKLTFEVKVNTGTAARVEWNFGDGTVTATAAHAYTNYGAFTVTAKVCCERCGRIESVQQNLSVVKTPPVASFVILPEKETFSVGGELTLVDESIGDVASVMWITNGVEVVGEPCGKLPVTLSKRPGGLTFGLRAMSSDGEASPVYERTVRVRFGWWAVMPILLASAVVWWLLFRLLTGNGPSGWTVYSWDGAVPKLMKGGYPEERKYTGKGVPLQVNGYWNWFSKKARIPLSKLLGYSDDGDAPSGGWGLVSAEEKFVFRAEGGKPHIEPPNIVIDESGIVADRDTDHYFLFRDAGDTIGANNQFIRVVVEEASSGWFCSALLILSTFAIIGTVFWLCLEYAV
jgi:hypothetical protein